MHSVMHYITPSLLLLQCTHLFLPTCYWLKVIIERGCDDGLRRSSIYNERFARHLCGIVARENICIKQAGSDYWLISYKCWRSFHENILNGRKNLPSFILSKTQLLTLILRWIVILKCFGVWWYSQSYDSILDMFKTTITLHLISGIRLGVSCFRFPTVHISQLSKWSYWPIELAHKLFLIDELSTEAEDSSGKKRLQHRNFPLFCSLTHEIGLKTRKTLIVTVWIIHSYLNLFIRQLNHSFFLFKMKIACSVTVNSIW